MGDEISITVIATGFKGNIPGQQDKQEEEANPFSSFLNQFNLNNAQAQQPPQQTAPQQQAPSFTQQRPSFNSAPSSNLFSKVGEDDGIDVPVFLRRKDR